MPSVQLPRRRSIVLSVRSNPAINRKAAAPKCNDATMFSEVVRPDISAAATGVSSVNTVQVRRTALWLILRRC